VTAGAQGIRPAADRGNVKYALQGELFRTRIFEWGGSDNSSFYPAPGIAVRRRRRSSVVPCSEPYTSPRVCSMLTFEISCRRWSVGVWVGVRAIFQLLQAHCTQLKHHALIQVLSNRCDDADGVFIRLGAVGPIAPGASNGRAANRLPDGADDDGQRKRQRTGETSAYRTIVEDAMDEFIEHVQTGSRTRLEGYLGPIDPETDPYVDRDGELIDDECEIAYRAGPNP
jgi:hypothetical protein